GSAAGGSAAGGSAAGGSAAGGSATAGGSAGGGALNEGGGCGCSTTDPAMLLAGAFFAVSALSRRRRR
ncbi:MAG: hypothetical protein IAE78_16420, partial [Myxococcus sp.]|nr:hypothetical protein [Myxococcus sp.]